jgi:hypothetical protein
MRMSVLVFKGLMHVAMKPWEGDLVAGGFNDADYIFDSTFALGYVSI